MSEEGFVDPPTAPTAPAVEASSWGRRFGAWVIDAVIFAIPIAFLTFGRIAEEFSVGGRQPFDPATGEVNEAVFNRVMEELSGFFLMVNFFSTVAFTLYLVLMHTASGQTLGKRALGIKVIKDDGSPCDLAAAGKRALVFPIAAGLPYIGFIVFVLNGLWPLWDTRRQSLGDKVGTTYVVRKSSTTTTLPVSLP